MRIGSTADLGWRPSLNFEEGLARTVEWYLNNAAWWEPLLTDRYQGERLGLARETDGGRAGKKTP